MRNYLLDSPEIASRALQLYILIKFHMKLDMSDSGHLKAHKKDILCAQNAAEGKDFDTA